MTGSPTWNPEISPSPDSWATGSVYFRSDAQGIHLHLPSTLPWEELWENLVWQLRSRKPYWAGVAPLTLWSQQRELDMPTLQLLAALLSQHGLQLWRVQTRSRSTAIAAATLGYSVEQSSLLEAVPLLPQTPHLCTYVRRCALACPCVTEDPYSCWGISTPAARSLPEEIFGFGDACGAWFTRGPTATREL